MLNEYTQSNGKLAGIATTDYSRVGLAYDVVPPGWSHHNSVSIAGYIRVGDKPILDAASTGDPRTIYKASCRTSMCGFATFLVTR